MNEVAIMERMFPPLSGMKSYQRKLRQITKASNELLFRVVEDITDACEAGGPIPWSEEDLMPECRKFLNSLMTERNAFVWKNQKVLMRSLGLSYATA